MWVLLLVYIISVCFEKDILLYYRHKLTSFSHTYYPPPKSWGSLLPFFLNFKKFLFWNNGSQDITKIVQMDTSALHPVSPNATIVNFKTRKLTLIDIRNWHVPVYHMYLYSWNHCSQVQSFSITTKIFGLLLCSDIHLQHP